MVCKTVYFEKPGPQNTEETLKLAKERAEELEIRNIVVASTTGETGAKASEVFKGYTLIVVSHVTGFRKPDFQELSVQVFLSCRGTVDNPHSRYFLTFTGHSRYL